MKRLTIRNSDGTVSQPTSTSVESVFYRLAEYEDTGFSPAEIEEMKWRINRIYKLTQQLEGNLPGLRAAVLD